MKGGFKLHERQQEQKENPEVPPTPCHICTKVVGGAYGRTWLGDKLVWSCSGKCEKEVAKLKEVRYDNPRCD